MIDFRLAAMGATMWFWAAVLRPLKRVVPLDTLVRLMHRRAGPPRSRRREARLEQYMTRTARFPFRAPANCLERSLAAYRLLGRCSAAPELVIGLRRKSGKVEGHVWVTVDGRPLAESSATLNGYTTVTIFDADGMRRSGDAGANESISAAQFK